MGQQHPPFGMAPAVCSPSSPLMTMGSKWPPMHVHMPVCTWAPRHPVRLRTTLVTVNCGPNSGVHPRACLAAQICVFSAAALLMSAQASPKTSSSLDRTALPAPSVDMGNRKTSTHSLGKPLTQCAYSAKLCIAAPTQTCVLGLFHKPQERLTPQQCTYHSRFGTHTTRMTQSTGPDRIATS